MHGEETHQREVNKHNRHFSLFADAPKTTLSKFPLESIHQSRESTV